MPIYILATSGYHNQLSGYIILYTGKLLAEQTVIHW